MNLGGSEVSTIIVVECPTCNPATSGYVRIGKPGSFAHYEKCSTCNVDGGIAGCVKIEVPLQIRESDVRLTERLLRSRVPNAIYVADEKRTQ